MEKLYLKNDFFVLPARNEVTSVSVVEALYFGLLFAAIRGSKSYLKLDTAGFIFSCGSQTSLSFYIKQLFDDSRLRQVMSSNAIKSLNSIASPQRSYHYFQQCLVNRWT